MEQSGYLSSEGVRSYERTTDIQRKKVSDILTDVTTSVQNSDDKLDEVDRMMLALPTDSLVDKSENPPSFGSVPKSMHFENMQGCTFTFCLQN